MVVGLGNPGPKYDGTRHNIGFDVLSFLQKDLGGSLPKSKFDGQISSVTVDSTTLILVWPLTYMNDSGRCVKAAASFYKIDCLNDLLIICDDLSLPLGKLRIRGKGSAGGQKGLNDILRVANTQDIARLRIGIDPTPPHWETSDYVLSRFSKDDRPTVDEAIRRAAEAVKLWCRADLAQCMNRFN